MAERLRVRIVHALRDRQVEAVLDVAPGTTVGQAFRAASDAGLLPPIPPAHRLGIFGRIVAEDRLIAHDDRIEILRPLVNDPKEIRRRRADALASSRRSARGR